MKHAVGLRLALMLGSAAFAAEPAVERPVSKALNEPFSRADASTQPRKRLDLRAGKIQNLMMPRDLEAMMKAPDFDREAVIVEGKRELLPMRELEPIPAGFPPATLWWALRNPAQSWRIVLPDVNAKALGPPVDKVPPREFRWGP